jgi:predicted kinase
MSGKCILVWFILGPIGAGKSTYIHKILETVKINYLSPDLVTKDKNLSYQEARSYIGNLMKEHIEEKKSFIIEGTGQRDELYNLFVSYKNNPDINLKVTFIDVDLETAIKRNKNRIRVLPESTVKEVYEKCYERRYKWKDFNCQYIHTNNIEKINIDNVY